jgi:hypothetical protein
MHAILRFVKVFATEAGVQEHRDNTEAGSLKNSGITAVPVPKEQVVIRWVGCLKYRILTGDSGGSNNRKRHACTYDN